MKLWATFVTRKSFKWLPKIIHHSPCITTLSIDLQEDIANPYLQAIQWHKQRKHRKNSSTHNPLIFQAFLENMIPLPHLNNIFDHNFGGLGPHTWELGFESFHSWTNPSWTSSTKISPSSLSTRRPNLWPIVRSTKTLYLKVNQQITHGKRDQTYSWWKKSCTS